MKQATIYNREKEYEKAVELLQNNIDSYTGNTDYINAHSGSCELLAFKQAKEKKHSEAMRTIDNALHYNSDSKSLLYTKGLIYEYTHQYDSAFYYQKFYEPLLLERAEYLSKMKGLRYKANKNQLDYEYMQARFSEQDVLTSVASVGYERHENKNIYSARLNYSGRNGSLFWNDEEATADESGECCTHTFGQISSAFFKEEEIEYDVKAE